MSPALPKTKFSAVIQEINSYVHDGCKVDELTLRRWEREALSVRKAGDEFEYFQLMGMISQISGDHQSTTCEYFLAAVQIRPNEPLALSNYSVALSLSRDYEGALDCAKKSYRIAREDGNYDLITNGLFRSILMCCRLGRFIEASELCEDYRPFNKPGSEFVNIDILDSASQFMVRNGISDEDVSELVALAYGIYAADYTHDSSRSGLGIVLDNVEPLLQVQVPVDGDGAYVSGLNDQLFDLIIDKDLPSHLMSILSCIFVPVDTNK